MPTVRESGKVCGMSVSVGLRRVRGLSEALIVNGRGSKSKMIASLSLSPRKEGEVK